MEDGGICAVIVGCPKLKYLNVGCSAVTDAALASIGRHSRAVAELHLHGTEITDGGVFGLVADPTTAAALRHLGLSQCTSLRDPSPDAIRAACTGLLSLHMLGCTGVSKAARRRLQGWPQLESLDCDDDTPLLVVS